MPIKQVHKSFMSINKKTFFNINFFFSFVTQMKKQKQSLSISTLFVELISILVDASMYFNHGFDFIFFILARDTIMNWLSETLGKLDIHQSL